MAMHLTHELVRATALLACLTHSRSLQSHIEIVYRHVLGVPVPFKVLVVLEHPS